MLCALPGPVWKFTVANNDISFTLTTEHDTYIQTSNVNQLNTVRGLTKTMILKTTGQDKYGGMGAVRFSMDRAHLSDDAGVKYAKLLSRGCMSSTVVASALKIYIREAMNGGCSSDPQDGSYCAGTSMQDLTLTRHNHATWTQDTATAANTENLLWEEVAGDHRIIGTPVETKSAPNVPGGSWVSFDTGITTLAMDTELSYGFTTTTSEGGNTLSTLEDGYPAQLELTFATSGTCSTGWNPGTDSTLSVLALSSGTLDPAFSPTVTTYTASVFYLVLGSYSLCAAGALGSGFCRCHVFSARSAVNSACCLTLCTACGRSAANSECGGDCS